MKKYWKIFLLFPFCVIILGVALSRGLNLSFGTAVLILLGAYLAIGLITFFVFLIKNVNLLGNIYWFLLLINKLFPLPVSIWWTVPLFRDNIHIATFLPMMISIGFVAVLLYYTVFVLRELVIDLTWHIFGKPDFGVSEPAEEAGENNASEAREKQSEELPLPLGQKKCWACGTVQRADRTFCINCDESI